MHGRLHESNRFCVETFSFVNSNNNLPVRYIRKPMDLLVLELYYQIAMKVNSISLADVCLLKVRHIHLYF